jgi:hypothetical protein
MCDSWTRTAAYTTVIPRRCTKSCTTIVRGSSVHHTVPKSEHAQGKLAIGCACFPDVLSRRLTKQVGNDGVGVGVREWLAVELRRLVIFRPD